MKKILSFLTFIAFAQFATAQTGNVGVGTSTPGSKMTVNGSFAAPYKLVSASGAVGANDYYIADSSSGNVTLTLPAAISGAGNFLGRTYHFKNTGSGVLTIMASGAELIDNQSGAGVSSFSVSPGYYAFIINKGTTTGTTWELAILATAAADGTNDAFINKPASTRVELGTNSDATTPRTVGTEFVVNDNGRVGIGNTNPTTTLHVTPLSGMEPARFENLLAQNDTTDVPVYTTAGGVLKKRVLLPLTNRLVLGVAGSGSISYGTAAAGAVPGFGEGASELGFVASGGTATGSNASSYNDATSSFKAPYDGDYYFSIKLSVSVAKAATDSINAPTNASTFGTFMTINAVGAPSYSFMIAQSKLIRGLNLGGGYPNYSENYSNIILRLKANDVVKINPYILGGSGATTTPSGFLFRRGDSYMYIFRL